MVKNLKGQIFKHLKVKERAGSDKRGHALWLCECDCGNTKIIPSHKLLEGQALSCGCMQHKYGHGMTDTSIYAVWCTMKARCNNPNSLKYHLYGGRGISVCDEWQHNFQTFYDWAMANGYKDGLSIDRINVNGNYEPSNCRWATVKEQANNRRTNTFVSFKGETHTVSEWSEILGISRIALYHRLERGWSLEKALATGK